MSTRIKICGLTRVDDVAVAAQTGADALGFVCYARSARYVPAERLKELAASVPPFVTPVLLFVNPQVDEVRAALEQVPDALLQFHGDEDEGFCAQFLRPWLRAVRMAQGVDLLDCERRFPSAIGLLADAPSAGFGGSGESFDWQRIPVRRSRPLVLAGGLHAGNVGQAIAQVRPWAVDVSSGVEAAPGIKDARRIEEFIAAVRAADQTRHS